MNKIVDKQGRLGLPTAYMDILGIKKESVVDMKLDLDSRTIVITPIKEEKTEKKED